MKEAQRPITALLILFLTLIFCFTALWMAPRPVAGITGIDDALVQLSDGMRSTRSDPEPILTGRKAVQTPLISAVQQAVQKTACVTLNVQNTAVYPTPLTVTAADCSTYRRANADHLTDGASITYSTLIPLTVTGLQSGAAHAEENYQVLEGVMDLVASFTMKQAAAYQDVMFKVTLPPGVYDMSYYNLQEKDSQCLHIYRNTWLSMKGVTIRKADCVAGAMLRNCLGSTGASGYDASGNLFLDGGTWDVQMAQFSPSSTTQRFSTIRLGHGKNILLNGVTFRGAINGHHVELCGIKGCSIVNCTFEGYLDTAYGGPYDRKEAIQIDVVNNDAIAPAFGNYDDAISGDVVVYGNTFRDLCRGVGGHNAVYGLYYSNVVVQNNTFSRLSGEAFYGLNYTDTLIADNTLRQVGAGIAMYALTASPDSNYFLPCGAAPPAPDSIQYKNTHISITGNDIQVSPFSSLPYGCGVLVWGGPYTGTFTGYRNTTFWIRGVTISGNRIRYARDAGIYLHCADDDTVFGNRIKTIRKGFSLNGSGICLEGSRPCVTLRGNQIGAPLLLLGQQPAPGIRILSPVEG